MRNKVLLKKNKESDKYIDFYEMLKNKNLRYLKTSFSEEKRAIAAALTLAISSCSKCAITLMSEHRKR